MAHLVTRSRIARVMPFILSPKLLSLRKTIPHPQTFTFASTHHHRRSQTPEVASLPEELSKNVVVLSCESTAVGGVCHVYVVGTAHVSEESRKQVQAIVKFLKPEAVFLELCKGRESVLYNHQIPKVPTLEEIMAKLKEKRSMTEVLLSWFYAMIGSELGVCPGSEFRVAYEEAIKYGGKVILGDRPAQITIRRTWSKMTLWHKTKYLYSLFFRTDVLPIDIDKVLMADDDTLNHIMQELWKLMDDYDTLNRITQELRKVFPIIIETIVDERDQYMSCILLKVASDKRSVVAVVGRGHLQGIQKYWKQPVMMKDLIAVPPPKSVNFATRICVVMAGVALTIIFTCVSLLRSVFLILLSRIKTYRWPA